MRRAACGVALTALGRSKLGRGEWRAERRVVERWTAILLEPAQLLTIRQSCRHAKVAQPQPSQPGGASAHEHIPRAEITVHHALLVDGLQRVEEAVGPRVALCRARWRLEQHLPQLLVDQVEQYAKFGLIAASFYPRIVVAHDRVALEQAVQLGLELGILQLGLGRDRHALDRILLIVDGLA